VMKKSTKGRISMFNWQKKKQTSQVMNEIDAIFQSATNDMKAWKRVKDVGKFSLKTMNEFKGVWGLVSSEQKKSLKKALTLLQSAVSAKTLMKILEMYLKSVGVTNERKKV